MLTVEISSWERKARVIKALRVYYGISQKEVAKELRVSQSTLSRMEESDYVLPYSQEKALKILRLHDPESDFRKALKSLLRLENG